MKIHSDNIDEYFFDYFEGDLKDEEKVELMNFIHQHPEYEKEFALWAQSYSIKDTSLKDYGLSGSLLRDQKPAIAKPWYYVIPGVILLSLYFLFQSSDKKESNIQVVPQNTILKKSVETPISFPATESPLKINKKESSVKLKDKEAISKQQLSFPSAIDTNHIPAIEQIFESKSSSIPDTIGKSVTYEKKENVSAAPSKEQDNKEESNRKKKKQIFLKPTPEFIPVNENF